MLGAQWAADNTTTLAGGPTILVLDMYEHGAKAAACADAFMEAIQWDSAMKEFDRVSRES
jgi:superoxide dismutase, Fe-Mn family